MIPRNSLQQLHDLDRASPQFHEQLSNFLRGNEYQNVFPKLQGEDFAWLIEYLDSVLVGIPDPTGSIFQECLHELGKICRVREILPKSCTVSDSLLEIGLPSTSGYAYDGALDGSKVRIQRVRSYPEGDPQEVKQTFHQVAATWKRLTHRNIVPLLGVTIDPLQLISDWMSGEDLMVHITNHPDTDRLSLLSDVAEGLNYLHSCNVIHGDLKGLNVLVDATDRARITDIGLAMVTQNLVSIRNTSANHGHNARWIAPEILGEQGTYSKEADVFSFAMVIIEVFTGTIPFSDKSPCAAISAIAGGERPPRPIDRTLTDGLWTLTQRCWHQEAHFRPKASEILHNFDIPAWKRLINRPLATDERISLVTAIFSDSHKTETVRRLRGDDAQTFINVIDETLNTLAPWLQRKCLAASRRICGRQALLPRSAQIPICYNRLDNPLYRGGYADVWKGEHQGRDVAVKVLRVYSTSDFDKITSRFCKEVVTWKILRHPNVLPLLGVTMGNYHFAMASEWMANGNINEFVKANRGVNRLELLKDVARGLIYMHGQAMIHGDLKGANILIDQNGHARLADFGLLTIISDPTNPTASSSTTNAGTTRWMSPELLHPDQFGFEDSRPTKGSDCYALGMVILEVLSGQAPFARYKDFIAMRKVIEGERPERPEGAWFTDDLWGTLEQCWSPHPKDRPTAEAVLECLERVSMAWQPLPPSADDDVQMDDDYESRSTVSSPSARMIPQSSNQPPVLSQTYSPGVVDQVVTCDDGVLLHRAYHSNSDSYQGANSSATTTTEAEDLLDRINSFKRSEVDPQFATDLDWVGPVGSSEPLQLSGAHKLSGISSQHNDPYNDTGGYSNARHCSLQPSPGSQQRLAELPALPDSVSVDQETAYPYELVYRPQALIDGLMGYSDLYRPPSWPPHLISCSSPPMFSPGSTSMIRIPSNNRGRRQVIVPQRLYDPHHRQNYFDQSILGNSITFLSHSRGDGIALTDVMNEKFDHLIGRDDPMFVTCMGSAIILRLEWPGYKVWDRQIRTKDWRREPKPITKAKLANEVAKMVQKFIQDSVNEPITPGSERWRVGPGFIEVRDLVLVRLVHVSKGSWQAEFRAFE